MLFAALGSRELEVLGITIARGNSEQARAFRKAGEILLRSKARITVINAEICRQVPLSAAHYGRLLSAAGPHRQYLSRQTWSWYVLRLGSFPVWDVVALAYLAIPNAFQDHRLSADISRAAGRPIHIGSGSRINAPLTIDSDRFWAWFLGSI